MRVCVRVRCRYLDPDMYSMMEDSSATLRSKKFMKLTKAICGLVSSDEKTRRFKCLYQGAKTYSISGHGFFFFVKTCCKRCIKTSEGNDGSDERALVVVLIRLMITAWCVSCPSTAPTMKESTSSSSTSISPYSTARTWSLRSPRS